MITIAMIALIAAIGSMSIGSMNMNAFARSNDDNQGDNDGNDRQGSSNDQQGSSDNQGKISSLCPPGHDCICTPASGVFHDRTTGFNINTGCTSDKG